VFFQALSALISIRAGMSNAAMPEKKKPARLGLAGFLL
jgi:hypothetical protein